jgi:hypothetical protein
MERNLLRKKKRKYKKNRKPIEKQSHATEEKLMLIAEYEWQKKIIICL